MSGTFGNNYKVTIFGESHGEAIGVVIDGLPAGFTIDENNLKNNMERRAPGRDDFSTSRKEPDKVKIVSGFVKGKTTGTPLCALVENQAQMSKDYESIKRIIRPGHADYTGNIKFKGFEDFRGGGHFSGRITLGLVIAGTIARQYLELHGIKIGAHIARISNINDCKLSGITEDIELLDKLKDMDFPVIDSLSGEKMKEKILEAKKNGDSVGGIIECKAIGLPAGIGDPFFNSLESTISLLVFSIPAVKGIEFGAGFEFAGMHGSEANDEFYLSNDVVKTRTNNNGGINGGISNGMPVIFSVVVKPTPSIAAIQHSLTLNDLVETELEIKGRHDACIVQRAVVVVESITAIALMEHIGGTISG